MILLMQWNFFGGCFFIEAFIFMCLAIYKKFEEESFSSFDNVEYVIVFWISIFICNFFF